MEHLEGLKTCIRCGFEKKLTEFYGVSGQEFRRMSWCKECHKKYSKQQRINLVLRRGEAYLQEERDRLSAYRSKDKEESSDRRRASDRAKTAAINELIYRHGREYRELLRYAKKEEGLLL